MSPEQGHMNSMSPPRVTEVEVWVPALHGSAPERLTPIVGIFSVHPEFPIPDVKRRTGEFNFQEILPACQPYLSYEILHTPRACHRKRVLLSCTVLVLEHNRPTTALS